MLLRPVKQFQMNGQFYCYYPAVMWKVFQVFWLVNWFYCSDMISHSPVYSFPQGLIYWWFVNGTQFHFLLLNIICLILFQTCSFCSNFLKVEFCSIRHIIKVGFFINVCHCCGYFITIVVWYMNLFYIWSTYSVVAIVMFDVSVKLKFQT